MNPDRRSWLLAAALSPLAGLRAADWPQFLGPRRDGSSEEAIRRELPKGGLKPLWKHEVGAGWAGPVAADGKVWIFHRVENFERLECLDAATGKTEWKADERTKYRDNFGFDEGPRATPVVTKEVIFTFGAAGELTAFDRKTGKKMWRKALHDDYQVKPAFFGTGSSPIVMDGELILNLGAKDAGFVAFDPMTGKELWASEGEAVSYSSPVAAKIRGEELAIFFTRDGLVGLSPKKGEIRFRQAWRPRNPNSVNAASPVVRGDQILVSTSYNTGAILVEVGKDFAVKKIWSNDESLSCHYSTPVLVGDFLFGIDGRQEYGGKLRCVEWATGKARWTEDTVGTSSLIAAKDAVLAWGEKGELVAFEPSAEKFKLLWRAEVLEGTCRAAPALADGVIYVRSEKELIAVEVGQKKD